MKITIDRDECIECGNCELECPEVFLVPSGDKSIIVEKYRTNNDSASGEVGEDLADCSRRAAESCPVEVIHIEE